MSAEPNDGPDSPNKSGNWGLGSVLYTIMDTVGLTEEIEEPPLESQGNADQALSSTDIDVNTDDIDEELANTLEIIEYEKKLRPVILNKQNKDDLCGIGLVGPEDKPRPSQMGGSMVFVNRVDENSLADKAKLQEGDCIVNINGHSARTLGLLQILHIMTESTRLELVVLHDMNGYKSMTAGVVQSPEGETREEPTAIVVRTVKLNKGPDGYGITLVGAEDQEDTENNHVYVTAVVKDSESEKAGIAEGDRILATNSNNTLHLDDILKLLADNHSIEFKVCEDKKGMEALMHLYTQQHGAVAPSAPLEIPSDEILIEPDTEDG